MQELLRHASSRVTMDTYTQAVTPAKRLAQAQSLASSTSNRKPLLLRSPYEPQPYANSLPLVPICAYGETVTSPQVIDLIWRPRRDLNPCYRRERAIPRWILL